MLLKSTPALTAVSCTMLPAHCTNKLAPLDFNNIIHSKPPAVRCCCCLQVDGPSMFPTFPGRGEWVLAEALPGLADRVKVGK